MASKGGVGLTMDLDKVPLRDNTMQPEEILLSESQERMLLVCEPAKFETLAAVFHRWGLDAVKIGEVKEKRTMELRWKGEVLTDIDPDLLVENAPQYERPFQPLPPQHRAGKRLEMAIEEKDPTGALKSVLGDARGTSREWIYRQYDGHVGAATARDCRDSVGIVRLKDSGRALGVVLGCRPYLMRFDATVGGIDSVAYPALELALKGFETLAVTDCLNYGNPEREQVMSEFVASVRSMSAMCEALNAPIISGNVSFYNETMGKNITPTPATGLVGLREAISGIPRSEFTRPDLMIFVLRLPGLFTGGVRQELRQDRILGIGELDVKAIASFINCTRELSMQPGVEATRAIGKLGLAYALARMSMNGIGAWVGLDAIKPIRGQVDANAIFEEHLYEAVFALDAARTATFEAAFREIKAKCPGMALHRIGRTEKGRLEIGSLINLDLSTVESSYRSGWRSHFERLG
jgi:phosphoribosylformylglycinamidine synthase